MSVELCLYLFTLSAYSHTCLNSSVVFAKCASPVKFNKGVCSVYLQTEGAQWDCKLQKQMHHVLASKSYINI